MTELEQVTTEVPDLDGLTDVTLDPKTTMDIANLIGGITKLQDVIDQYNSQMREAEDFYKNKIDGVTKQIEFLKGTIAGYLRYHNASKLVTHRGTAYYATRTKSVWPSDDHLLAWARVNGDSKMITLIETPNKSVIKEAIKNGAVVPGYEVVEQTDLNIRRAI